MRIFKTKHFARFATKEDIADVLLRDTVRRADRDNIDRQELKAFRLLAAEMLALDEAALRMAMKNGTILEIE
jgi:hypothetical protein